MPRRIHTFHAFGEFMPGRIHSMKIYALVVFGEFIPWRIHGSLHLENSYREEFIPFFYAHDNAFLVITLVTDFRGE